jgi:hypothetical protein
LSGNWLPYYLQPLQTYNVIAELTAVFHALVQFFFGTGSGSEHLTGAIFSLVTTLVVGLLFYL